MGGRREKERHDQTKRTTIVGCLTVDSYHGYYRCFSNHPRLAKEGDTVQYVYFRLNGNLLFFPYLLVCSLFFFSFFFWDLVDFKLSGLILSSLLASCILGFHQRSCAHDMFAILLCEIVSTTLHVILIFYFIFTIFLTGLGWIM